MKTHRVRLASVGLIFLLIFFLGSANLLASSGRPVLKKDMSGSAVKTLQLNLKQLGYLSAKPTGYYGDATVAAVKKFQRKYGIPATGMVASLTYGKIDSLLKPAKKTPSKPAAQKSPDKAPAKAVPSPAPQNTTSAPEPPKPDGLMMGSVGQEVLKLQNNLIRLGYMSVSPTGDFGSITESALIQFQKYYRLESNGIAGPDTLAIMERLLEQSDSMSRGDVDRNSSNLPIPVTPFYNVELQWISGLPIAPFLKGVGRYEGVVVHFTENYQDTAQIEANYEKTHWRDAYVHEFIDAGEIIQVANPDYKAWGAGPYANDRFIHLELCHSDTQSDFDASFDKITQRAAEYLYRYQLGVLPAKSDGTGTLWGHMDVSRYLGGTDHQDPVSYLQRWGKSWDDVVRTVNDKYAILATGKKNTQDGNATQGSTSGESAGSGSGGIGSAPAGSEGSDQNSTINGNNTNTATTGSSISTDTGSAQNGSENNNGSVTTGSN